MYNLFSGSGECCEAGWSRDEGKNEGPSLEIMVREGFPEEALFAQNLEWEGHEPSEQQVQTREKGRGLFQDQQGGKLAKEQQDERLERECLQGKLGASKLRASQNMVGTANFALTVMRGGEEPLGGLGQGRDLHFKRRHCWARQCTET